MLAALKRYEQTLLRFQKKARFRRLETVNGIPFSTNDYLALANSSHLKKAIQQALDKGVSIGAGSSRLVSGHSTLFEELEALAADFFGSEKALFFNCGYMANTALFATLPQRQDHIFYDEYIHASVLDGIKQSKAQATAFKHNDLTDLQNKICLWRAQHLKGYPWIAVESLYSMEGDFAPLIQMQSMANKYQGFLVVDEAHATGVYGAKGEGLLQAAGTANVISVHTCGKALGSSGAILTLNQVFYHYLINRARHLIYTTAPSPLMAAAVIASIHICKNFPEYRKQLFELYNYANHQLANRLGLRPTNSQIIPIILQRNDYALQISRHLQAAGFDIKAIRPPTVKEDTARLRLSISRHITYADIDNLFELLIPLMRDFLCPLNTSSPAQIQA